MLNNLFILLSVIILCVLMIGAILILLGTLRLIYKELIEHDDPMEGVKIYNGRKYVFVRDNQSPRSCQMCALKEECDNALFKQNKPILCENETMYYDGHFELVKPKQD